jgi:hypothetical protein
VFLEGTRDEELADRFVSLPPVSGRMARVIGQ